jgi:heptosyltransferase-2
VNILIVKLGALGDVLRTTPLLTGLKKKFPQAAIDWIVDERHRDVLEANPHIRILDNYSPGTLARLADRRYDLAINLDKDAEALDTIAAAHAEKKMGFGRDRDGGVCALDSLSDYAVRLGLDDELKFRINKKTYQEISFEQTGLRFEGEEYLFTLDPENARFSEKLSGELHNGASGPRPVVGLNTGAGSRFAGKRLPVATTAELARRFHFDFGAAVLLLGGPEEIERNQEIERVAACPVINTGTNPIRRFAAIVKACDLIISGDTTGMHIAIAMKVPLVTYFASTCSAEIELYGRGRKIISKLACAPCYKRVSPYDEQCMKDMSAEQILEASVAVLKPAVAR